MTERRASYDPTERCGWCGATRAEHDRLTRAWEEYCLPRAAYFARVPQHT